MTTALRNDLNLSALGISLCLHAAVLLLVPHLDHTPRQPPLRIEVELAQALEAQPNTPPEPAPPQPPELPKSQSLPRPQPKSVTPEKAVAMPVLTAQQESESSAPEEYLAPESPMPGTVESVPPDTAQVTLPAEPVVASPPPGKSAPRVAARLESAEEAGEDEAWQGYGQLLHDMVGKNKKYPQIAIRRSLQGRVTVSARISMGKLIDIALIDSSGHKVLDEEALAMVRKAVNVLPVKDILARKSFTVVVPVDFILEG